MCGILAVIGSATLEEASEQSIKLTHRGPDERGSYQSREGSVLCHERLSIVDLHSGKQPIFGAQKSVIIHNGEIYNHEELRETLGRDSFSTHSDSEVIVRLYEEEGISSLDKLDGVFAFVILDDEKVFAGRDALGVKPLFYGVDSRDRVWFASESKALISVCDSVTEFPPGHYFTEESGFVKWYKPAWLEGAIPTSGPESIKQSLTDSVKKRLMSDVPLGVLLSGGLDSSLVASIVCREMKQTGKKVKTFSVGLTKDSPDLIKAKKVADFIGSEHHEIVFSVEDGIQSLRELISKIETYDVTSIRASTPMYIMTKYIREQGVKVVLSGEGADEMFGGYLYFQHAPDASEFHGECVRRLKRLYTSDILRADRSTMGQGVEARVPFLDKSFLKVVMELDPKHKVIDRKNGRIEKHVLRAAFDTKENPYLPDEVLWRQKEQFSDGVGYSWVDGLKAYAEVMIADSDFDKREDLYPHNTPTTKEAFLYRSIFAEFFPHKDSPKQVKKWIPKWQEYDVDPSGRANKGHEESYHAEPVVTGGVWAETNVAKKND